MPQPIRRVVTGHDKSGKAIVVIDGPAGNVRVRESTGTASTLLWVADKTPTSYAGNEDTANQQVPIAPPLAGSIFRTVEFPPEKDAKFDTETVLKEMGVRPKAFGGQPARHHGMHRTESVDYAIVMSGEIDMWLDDSEVHLKAGDVVIQRGTNHAWVNKYAKPCVIAFILVGATG
ncbi:MAG: cupin domain-containing protein [Alphaproteobacteria bacterium]|nr:cupin domain-containing protein [Alphaproteobacteria bacterium]